MNVVALTRTIKPQGFDGCSAWHAFEGRISYFFLNAGFFLTRTSLEMSSSTRASSILPLSKSYVPSPSFPLA